MPEKDASRAERPRREVVLSVRFYSNNDNVKPYLQPSGTVGEYPAERFIQEARSIIETELPRELESLFGVRVKTRVIDVREGSILIFFGAVIESLATFARYKSLVESIDLLRRQLERLLKSMINRRFPSDIDVDVNVEYPSLPNRHDWEWGRRKFLRDPEDDLLAGLFVGGGASAAPRRDGFFWFLLLLCILEGAGLVVLVWRAVSHTYFSSP